MSNIRIQDLPPEVDRIINSICAARGKFKWEIVREALIEFADNHKEEVIRLVG